MIGLACAALFASETKTTIIGIPLKPSMARPRGNDHRCHARHHHRSILCLVAFPAITGTTSHPGLDLESFPGTRANARYVAGPYDNNARRSATPTRLFDLV